MPGQRVPVTQERPEPFQGAAACQGSSLGLEMDVDTINVLESAYWTPRGENFDFATRRQYLGAGNAADDSQCREILLPVKRWPCDGQPRRIKPLDGDHNAA